MRCVHCAAEVGTSAIFCGVCGRRAREEAVRRPEPPPDPSLSSPSLFEVPISPGARAARVAVVLIIDAVLVGAGLAMAWSWWSNRLPDPPVVQAATLVPDAPTSALPEVELPPARVIPHPATDGGGRRPAAVRPGTRPSDPWRPGPAPRAPDASTGFPGFPGLPGLPTAPIDAPRPTPYEPDAPTAQPADAEVAPGPGPTADAPVIDPDPGTDSVEEGVRQVVRSQMVHVKRCYTHAAKAATSGEPIEGKVEVQFTVTTTGDAADVRVVENTTTSEALGECVAALLASWRFPIPPEDVEFVWPFVFKAPR